MGVSVLPYISSIIAQLHYSIQIHFTMLNPLSQEKENQRMKHMIYVCFGDHFRFCEVNVK
jgi:hypothetical protein